MLMAEEPWYWDYLEKYGIYDEIEGYVGIRDDAPDDVKKAFNEDLAQKKKIREKSKKEGYLIG